MFGISPSAVSFWESGKNNIDWRCATTLAEKFHVTPEYLLGETDIIDSASIQAPAAVRIPVIGTIRAGIPLAAIEDIEDWEEIPADMPLPRLAFPRGFFLVIAEIFTSILSRRPQAVKPYSFERMRYWVKS